MCIELDGIGLNHSFKPYLKRRNSLEAKLKYDKKKIIEQETFNITPCIFKSANISTLIRQLSPMITCFVSYDNIDKSKEKKQSVHICNKERHSDRAFNYIHPNIRGVRS